MREKEYLKQRYCAILSSAGTIFLLAGLVMLAPLSVLFAYPGEVVNALSFVAPAGCLGLAGLLLKRLFPRASNVTLSIQEGGVIVLISWVVVILFSAWPLMAVLRLPFSRALFESVSGWTTTGLSVVDVTKAGPMVLFWRSTMQLAGGAGLAIIMMSAIAGPTGVGVSAAEGRGDQLVPNVRRSARLVLIIYTCYAGIGTIAYWAAGMSVFDAFNHSFAAVSTGGFSTRADSIGSWDSAAIEAVSLPLMVLGNLSFVTAWFLWRGRLKAVVCNGEVRLMAALIPLSAATVFVFTCRGLYPAFSKAFRVAIFETVTALTTTGFSTVSYGKWNAFGMFVLIVLMLVGGGTCSTAGGIKQFRIYLLWKLLIWELKRSLMPRSVVMERPIWEGNRRVFVDDARVRQVGVFVFLYLLTYMLGTLILCASGYSLQESLFEFASAIGTVGLSIGVTSIDMPDVALWAETFAMFLGRLEFLVIFTSLIKLVGDAAGLMTSASDPKGG
ncbi:MAG: TrkH family potassium uptake protein [Thermodesulfobacteriota bacterium]